jgi:selenide,water dikinase
VLEPIYGLVALGLVHPDKVKRNSSAKAGDVLILGKPLGVGILSAALKKGKALGSGLPGDDQVDDEAQHAGRVARRHAGRACANGCNRVRPCRAPARDPARLQARGEIRFADLPLISEAVDWAKQGTKTGATDRNWNGYGHDVKLAAGAPDWQRAIVTDPQTSGGLLVACAPNRKRKSSRRSPARFAVSAPHGHQHMR